MDTLGRVKGMGGSLAGRLRWAREGRTDSRRRTWVASARMGEGVMEQKLQLQNTSSTVREKARARDYCRDEHTKYEVNSA
jgi:hypothetical protein